MLEHGLKYLLERKINQSNLGFFSGSTEYKYFILQIFHLFMQKASPLLSCIHRFGPAYHERVEDLHNPNFLCRMKRAGEGEQLSLSSNNSGHCIFGREKSKQSRRGEEEHLLASVVQQCANQTAWVGFFRYRSDPLQRQFIQSEEDESKRQCLQRFLSPNFSISPNQFSTDCVLIL